MNSRDRHPLRSLASRALVPALFCAAAWPALAAPDIACPEADAEALGWLDRMSRSLHEVNYHGVVTLQRGDDLQVMQVSHSVTNGSSTERLTQLTGQGAQVERVDHPLECVHPGHKLLQLGADLKAGNCGIALHYRFSVGEGERVAGRQAVRIRIEPRDMYRYGYVMELDRETALLLKTQTLGRGDAVLERFQFANLSFQDQSPDGADVEVIHEALHPHPMTQTTGPTASNPWRVAWVPSGFTATDDPPPNSGRRTYTDGLAVFSVFLGNWAGNCGPARASCAAAAPLRTPAG